MDGPGPDGFQRVGHPALGVIMGVNSQRHSQLAADGLCDRMDFMRQRSSIGIAQNQPVGSGICRGPSR